MRTKAFLEEGEKKNKNKKHILNTNVDYLYLNNLARLPFSFLTKGWFCLLILKLNYTLGASSAITRSTTKDEVSIPVIQD